MNRTIRMKAWLATALLAAALRGTQAASVAPPPSAPAGTDKTAAPGKAAPKNVPGVNAAAPGTPGAPTIEDIYTSGAQRDPFAPILGGHGGKGKLAQELPPGEEAPAPMPAGLMHLDDFSIHSLQLKGVMEDRTGGFAVLIDSKFGASFVLKHGKLYDARNKPVPGVTGSVKVKEKTVRLMTPDRDSETLSLNHDDDKDAGEAPDAEPGSKDKP